MKPFCIGREWHLPETAVYFLLLPACSSYRGGWLDRLKLYCLPKAAVGHAYPGAVAAVTHLRELGLEPVFVSARQKFAYRNTSHWLHVHGLNASHLYLSPITLPESQRAAWKASVIKSIQQNSGLTPVAGVGDRPSDLQAYVACNIAAVGVCQGTAQQAGVPSAVEPQQQTEHTPFKDGATNALLPHEQAQHLERMLAASPLVHLHVLGGSGGGSKHNTQHHSSLHELWGAVKDQVMQAAECTAQAAIEKPSGGQTDR